jgi:hypothetical protein
MQHRLVQQIFPRLYEIYALSDQRNQDNCLYGFSDLTPESNGNWIYEYYETLFQQIDRDNWEVFKEKLSEKVLGIRKRARISIIGKSQKQKHSPMYPKFQGFDYFNEVHGYIYLKEKKCCEKVTFLQENNTTLKKTPDLKGIKGNSTIILDVKTINTSDDLHAYFERVVRDEKKTPEEKSIDLDYPMTEKEIRRGLGNKIESDVEHAKGQMASFQGAQKIVLFVIDLDDPNVRVYLWQTLKEIDEKNEEIQIVSGLQSLWRPQNKGWELFYHH